MGVVDYVYSWRVWALLSAVLLLVFLFPSIVYSEPLLPPSSDPPPREPTPSPEVLPPEQTPSPERNRTPEPIETTASTETVAPTEDPVEATDHAETSTPVQRQTVDVYQITPTPTPREPARTETAGVTVSKTTSVGTPGSVGILQAPLPIWIRYLAAFCSIFSAGLSVEMYRKDLTSGPSHSEQNTVSTDCDSETPPEDQSTIDEYE